MFTFEDLLNYIKFVRYYKGGTWVKTKKRGWITIEVYKFYIACGFNPIFIKKETYD